MDSTLGAEYSHFISSLKLITTDFALGIFHTFYLSRPLSTSASLARALSHSFPLSNFSFYLSRSKQSTSQSQIGWHMSIDPLFYYILCVSRRLGGRCTTPNSIQWNIQSLGFMYWTLDLPLRLKFDVFVCCKWQNGNTSYFVIHVKLARISCFYAKYELNKWMKHHSYLFIWKEFRVDRWMKRERETNGEKRDKIVDLTEHWMSLRQIKLKPKSLKKWRRPQLINAWWSPVKCYN